MNVLVVDDEPAICWGIDKLLGRNGNRVLQAGSAEKGLELARQNAIDLVFLDVRLPGISGTQALGMFHKVTNHCPIIIMSAFGDLDVAIEVVKQGACDYLHKPFGLDDVLSVCEKAARLKQNANQSDVQQPCEKIEGAHDQILNPSIFRIVGNSPAIQRVFRQIALVADSDLSVLITGETGTGKELVAAAIHRHSARKSQPYVPIAPVTFSASLLESELFGHVRGAFTGATEDRVGLFETASGGTILLDEIGDLPMSMQVKLLRVLEQKQFSRVGEIRNRLCNVRILSATHQDLQKSVSEGRFRQDLLYRLGVAELHLPPLRERVEDIQPLVIHFLQLAGYPNAMQAVYPELIAQLQRRSWPGNIRELRNAVERAAVVARGRPLDLSDFPSERSAVCSESPSERAVESVLQWAREVLASDNQKMLLNKNVDDGSTNCLYDRFLSTIEPPLFQAVLESVDGNRSAAAEALGMHRATLRQRLKRYGLE